MPTKRILTRAKLDVALGAGKDRANTMMAIGLRDGPDGVVLAPGCRVEVWMDGGKILALRMIKGKDAK